MSEELVFKQIKDTLDDNEKIRGHLAHIDKTRLVFIGRNIEKNDCHYIGFRNEDGKDTLLTLSFEAMAMLVQLYNKKYKGDQVFPIKIETKWRLVQKEKE